VKRFPHFAGIPAGNPVGNPAGNPVGNPAGNPTKGLKFKTFLFSLIALQKKLLFVTI